jgi:two-component system, LytTR family, response regulator
MNRIKTLIVDDEKPARRALRGLLEKDDEIEVVGEAADGARALELFRALRPRLLFLDLQMPMLTGMEFLEELRPAERPEVVFVTAYDNYAVKAFEYHAVDYLMKPFSDSRFLDALEHAKERVRGSARTATDETLRLLLEQLRKNGAPTKAAPAANGTEHARLVVKADGQLHFLNRRDIRWIEGQGDFVKIHLRERGLMVRKTMGSVEKSLECGQFARIHKSTIVNLSSVRRVVPMLPRGQGMELDDGTTLPIGPSYRDVLDQFK